MADKVSIGVELTGTAQARQDADSLAASLQSIYSTLNAGTGAGTTTRPAGSPAIVPGTTNGLGQYNSPVNSSSSTSGINALTGTIAPALSYPTGVSPGMIPVAPNPHGTGGNYGPAPVPPGGGGQGGNGGGSNVINVNIVGSIPLAFTGGGGGGGGAGGGGGQGGYGYGGGGGGAGYGGGGGGGNGQSAPSQNPYASGFNPFKAGGAANINSFAQSALGYVRNPAALMGLIPAPIAIAGAAITAGFQAAEANYAAYRPTYDLETSLQAAPLRGQTISPLLKPGMAKVAEDQGNINYYEAHRNTIYGLAGRVGSLGIADWYYNTKIRPTLDRKLALDSAESEANPIRFRFNAATGTMPGTNDGSLSIRNSLFGSAGSFGTGALSALQSTGGFKPMVDRGFSSDDAKSVANTIYGVAGSQQNGALFSQIRGGADPLSLATASLPGLIATANIAGINALRPQIGNAATDAAINQARGTFQLGVTAQINQAKTGSAEARISMLGATGGGYQAISGAMGVQAGTLDATRTNLNQQMALATAAGNTGQAAQIKTQIEQLNAQQAGMKQQAAMTVFSGRGVDNQALSIGASNQMYGAMYGGGGQAGVDRAFGSDRAAKLAEANRLADMSKSQFISPEQRQVYARQSDSLRQQATIGVDRDKSQYDYSITQGRIGVQGAQAGYNSTNASLFGNAGDIYKATIGANAVTASQLGAVNARLNDPTAHLSEPEKLDLQKQSIDLLKQYNQTLIESSRSFYQMTAAVQHTSESIVGIGVSMQLQLGIGGARGSGLIGQTVRASTASLTADQATLANLQKQGVDKNSLTYKNAEAAVAQGQASQMNRLMSYSSLPPSLSVQSQLSSADFDLNMAGKAYMPNGNRRGALDNKLSGLGTAGSEMNAQYQAQMKDIRSTLTGQAQTDALAKAAYDHQQNQQHLAMNAADTMQDLASNWMQQNIAMSINMPSRGSFATSQFTQRQAAPYMQAMGDIYNGQYGFSGVGATTARDRNFDRYNRFQNLSMGNINTAEGFMATAMSGVAPRTGSPGMALGLGANPAMMGGVLHPIPIKFEIHVTKDAVTVSSGGISQTVSTKGGNAPVIHAISNGAYKLVESPHTSSGSSHQ